MDDRGASTTVPTRPADDDGLSVAEQHARAKIRSALFGSPRRSAKVGRYHLLEEMGSGAMGLVFSGFDPTLERSVAVKILRPTLLGDSRLSLELEARALARLEHPNVVGIYDVEMVDGNVALVMELVKGDTLDTWMRARSRSWREVLDVFIQAARGLEAAHRLDLVHRDFKPPNVIVGRDGRVRVLDFGLALPTGGEATGAAGTPAYMAPEQMRGIAGPAADQFSFCVALYEALYGQRPFEGSEIDELRAEIEAGRIRPPPRERASPGWLWAAVRRGLDPEPDRRHESMSELIDALGRDRRAPGRWAATIGIAGVAAAIAWASAGGRATGDPCDAGAARAATVWNAERKASLRASLEAGGDKYLQSAADHILGGFDAYAADWVGAFRAACRANRQGAEPAIALTRRSGCLDRRLAAFETAYEVLLDIDSGHAGAASAIVAELPPIEHCADTEALLRRPLPDDEAARTRVESLERDLDRARALWQAKESWGAVDGLLSRVIASAEKADYPPLLAEALLERGALEISRFALDQAVPTLKRAELIAYEQGDLAVALEASARRLYAEGLDGADVLSGIEPLERLSRAPAVGSLSRLLLLNNVGAVLVARGQRAEAYRWFARADGELEKLQELPSLELMNIRRNLAMLTSNDRERERLARSVSESLAARLGPSHPLALEALAGRAHYTRDPAEARRVLAEACEAYRAYHAQRMPESTAKCFHDLAFLGLETGDLEAARRRSREAERLANNSLSDRSLRDRVVGYSRYFHGDLDAALAALVPESRRETAESWWLALNVAEANIGIAMVGIASGQERSASEALERAVELLEPVVEINEYVNNQRRLALARLLLAETLDRLDASGNRERIVELASAADGWYRDGSGYQSRRARIAELLAPH